jgi:hypothetical protein
LHGENIGSEFPGQHRRDIIEGKISAAPCINPLNSPQME